MLPLLLVEKELRARLEGSPRYKGQSTTHLEGPHFSEMTWGLSASYDLVGLFHLLLVSG